MPSALQIYDARERVLVGLADLALVPLRWFAGRPAARPVGRVLLLRLERIGDLLMVLEAIRETRRQWPDAEIDLAVGRWNAPLAMLIPELSRVETADAPWLARPGESAGSWWTLLRRAYQWRRRRYDLVINFEPDIRSNLLAWIAGAPRRVGYASGGGGAFLTDATSYVPGSHVATNARALVRRAAGRTTDTGAASPSGGPRLVVPADAALSARAALGAFTRPLVGIHASGGRESKQWHLDRFADVARALASDRKATIVLTGGPADRAEIDRVKDRLIGVRVIDVGEALELPALAALLAELDLFITGDTGPMHLASAMGTPIVALYGPSNPARYGPQAAVERVLRIDLPCSPCGQVRLPPERCRGHVPDCLDGISVAAVIAAAIDVLDRTNRSGPPRLS
jgi:lipopolysaccharide heptosyltransferase II